jgi:hypothetical protein
MDYQVQTSAGPKNLGSILANQQGALPTEDVLHVMLPLMKVVAALHENGQVALLGPQDVVETEGGEFALAAGRNVPPQSNQAALRAIQPQASSGLKIVGEYRVTNDDGVGTKVEDLRAESDESAQITKPVYLPDLRSWEREVGHHDEITDVFQIGIILACVACGLDPKDADDIDRFSRNRANLFAIQPRLHPVIASII